MSFSLIGLVAVFIHLGYSIGLSAREKAEASLEAYQAAQASLDVISRQIASMVPYVSSQEHQGRPVQVLLFRASPQSLGFVTTWSAASGLRRGAAVRAVLYGRRRPRRQLRPRRRPRPPPPPAAACCSTNGRCPPRPGCGAPSSGASPKPRTTASWPIWPRPRAGPRSLTLAEGLASVAFRRLARPQEESFPLGSRIDPRRFRRRSRRNPRPQLPAGIQLSLRWNGQGPWGSKDFTLAVPVGGH